MDPFQLASCGWTSTQPRSVTRSVIPSKSTNDPVHIEEQTSQGKKVDWDCLDILIEPCETTTGRPSRHCIGY